MKKIIATALGLTLTTATFAAVNCVKNDNCAKDQLKQEPNDGGSAENGSDRNIIIYNYSMDHGIYLDRSSMTTDCFYDHNDTDLGSIEVPKASGPNSPSIKQFKFEDRFSGWHCAMELGVHPELKNVYLQVYKCKNGDQLCDRDQRELVGPWMKVDMYTPSLDEHRVAFRPMYDNEKQNIEAKSISFSYNDGTMWTHV